MLESGAIDLFWAIFLTLGLIFGGLNAYRWFNPIEPEVIEEYKRIINAKDKIIKEYEIKLEICLRLKSNDKRETLE